MLLPAEEARIPLADRGFLHGDGALETIRLHRGSPFRFPRHMARLEESLRLLAIDMPMRGGKLAEGARSLVEAERISEGLLRITITAPDAGAGRAGHVAMTVRPLPQPPADVVLEIADAPRRVPGPLSRCKTIARAFESAALRRAARTGAFDAVLLNVEGRVAETTARNLFVTSSGEVRTPAIEEGALPGITRSAVLEAAKSLGLSARETSVTVEELRSAEEVFLTGSGVGILGVAQVAGQRLPSCPGRATTALRTAYASLVERDAHW